MEKRPGLTGYNSHRNDADGGLPSADREGQREDGFTLLDCVEKLIHRVAVPAAVRVTGQRLGQGDPVV